jgi:hypothetical protein
MLPSLSVTSGFLLIFRSLPRLLCFRFDQKFRGERSHPQQQTLTIASSFSRSTQQCHWAAVSSPSKVTTHDPPPGLRECRMTAVICGFLHPSPSGSADNATHASSGMSARRKIDRRLSDLEQKSELETGRQRTRHKGFEKRARGGYPYRVRAAERLDHDARPERQPDARMRRRQNRYAHVPGPPFPSSSLGCMVEMRSTILRVWGLTIIGLKRLN